MFSLKQEVLHDVSLENHLERLAGSPHTLQAVGVNPLLLVEDQSGFDPFRRWNYVCPSPAHGLQFLKNKILKVWLGEAILGPHRGFLQSNIVPTKV